MSQTSAAHVWQHRHLWKELKLSADIVNGCHTFRRITGFTVTNVKTRCRIYRCGGQTRCACLLLFGPRLSIATRLVVKLCTFQKPTNAISSTQCYAVAVPKRQLYPLSPIKNVGAKVVTLSAATASKMWRSFDETVAVKCEWNVCIQR